MRETKDDSMIRLGQKLALKKFGGHDMAVIAVDEQAKDLFLDRPAQNEVHGPRKVQLYKTNRKQRRAQQAYNRKHKKDKP